MTEIKVKQIGKKYCAVDNHPVKNGHGRPEWLKHVIYRADTKTQLEAFMRQKGIWYSNVFDNGTGVPNNNKKR